MKKNGLIDKTMHFLVHNSNFVTVMVMGMVHAVLLAIMLAVEVTPLVSFNILSVIVYIFCMVLCRTGHVLPVYISIVLEVTAYTIISTYYIGLRCGTYCFLFSIVPIIIYLGCFLFKGKARWHIVVLLLLNFGLFIYLYVKFARVKPVYELSETIMLITVIFSAFVMVFSTIFYNIIYIYSSEVEVDDLEEKNKQLTIDAREDALTGMLNRRGFVPIVEKLMNDKGNAHFSVSFLDIDNFKRINDSYGHDGGDEVIRHITKLISREMKGCNTCRWGGEEFIILMENTDLAAARKEMEYLRKVIETSPTVFFNKRIPATITIGVEEYRDIYSVPEDIINVADERMYYGKQNGKNIVIYEDH